MINVNLDNSGDCKKSDNSQAEASDLMLLTQIIEGRDRDALALLYQRYRSPLARFLTLKRCDHKLIDEIYNDVMLTVWRNASQFEGKSKVSTWIFGIAYRVHLSHHRKEKRHQHAELSHVSLDEIDNSADESHDNSELMKAIGRLSDKHRFVIIHSYFFGYTTEEIAALEGCPQNTVKTRLHHARQKLKSALIETNQVDHPEKQQSKGQKDESTANYFQYQNLSFSY